MIPFVLALFACVHAFEVPLANLKVGQDENLYVTRIGVGTPAQNFNLLLSSGQPYLWVPNKECRSCQATYEKLYDHHASSTCEKDGAEFADDDSFLVEGGSNQGVSGYMSTDTVTFGGGLVARRMKFGEANASRVQELGGGMGVLGMGRKSKPGSFVEQLAAQGVIQRAVVGISLDGGLDEQGVGELSLGAPDESKYDASTLTALSAMDSPSSAGAAFKNFWRVAIQSVTLNGKPFDTVSRFTGVVLNTAEFGIFAPKAEALAIANLIPKAQWLGSLWIVPMNVKISLTFSFGGGMAITLTEKELVMKNPVFGDQYGVLYLVGDDSAQGWVLGTRFLHKVYTVIDYSDDTVSLAAKKTKKQGEAVGGAGGALRLPLATRQRSKEKGQEADLHV